MSQIWMLRRPTIRPWILIPHSDWFISQTPQQIMPLINRNDASILTSFFPFLRNFQGLMRNAWGNRNTIKAAKLSRKRVQAVPVTDLPFDYTSVWNSLSFLMCHKSAGWISYHIRKHGTIRDKCKHVCKSVFDLKCWSSSEFFPPFSKLSPLHLFISLTLTRLPLLLSFPSLHPLLLSSNSPWQLEMK